MSRLLALLLAVPVAQPAFAAPDLKKLHGVWEGRVGNLPVRACYSGDDHWSEGKYFYSRHLRTIPLIADEKMPGDLAEGWPNMENVARWRLTAISHNRAEGTWTGNGRMLPIRLTRVPYAADDEFNSPCGSLAFVGPIFAAGRTSKSQSRVNGVPIEKWSFALPDASVSLESFQLRGSGPAVDAINRRLRQPFDQAGDGWKWCIRNAGSFGGSYHDGIEPKFVTARWLAVDSFNESFCGGAHPNNSNSPILFDRKSGAIVSLYDWFKADSVHRKKTKGYEGTLDSIAGPLAKAVLKAHPRTGDDECAESVESASTWSLELRAEGIAFTPGLPRVDMACGDEVELPWATIAPFLNATGKREVAALRSALERR